MTQKRYKIQELARMLQSGQLGYSQQHEAFLFKPKNLYDPRIGILMEEGWDSVRDIDDTLRAYPTLENYNLLDELGLDFYPTERVQKWYLDFGTQNVDLGKELKESVLFDYQKEGASFLSWRDRAMLSLSPGLGKTLTSSYAAGLRGFKNVLAVVPASLLYYWKSELLKWSDHLPLKPLPVVWHKKVYEDLPDNLDEPNTQFWAITNPETVLRQLDKFFSSIPFDCLIVDESIMYKHRDSQRSQAIKSLAKSIDTVWFLTGAPATRYLDDMWHQFHILKPKGYRSYWRFTRRYCIVDDDDWGSKVIANKLDGEENIKKNFADIYFARSQDEVADIPDWIFESIDVPMHLAQERAYHKLREQLVIDLEGVEDNRVLTVDNHLSLMIRSIQLASNPMLVGAVNSSGKWDVLPELMNIYPGPYIIWVNFIETGKLIQAMLSSHKYRTALANGSTKMEDRQKMVDAFQNGKLDVIILNNQVGKFGFTLTKARTAFFVERMYDDSYYQCLHRNRRIGTTQSPIVVNMRSVYRDGHSTIDHVIDSVLDYRVGMIQKVTAGMLRKAFSG